MAELTWIPGALRGLGAFYVVLAIASLVYALIKPKTAWTRGWAVAGVVALFVGLPVGVYIAGADERQQRKEQEARLAEAKARFEKRCQSAGEKIHRTVENVEGVVLLKLRSKTLDSGDQFLLDDPYGHDCSGDECISGYLIDSRMVAVVGGTAPSNQPVYQYVEIQDATSGKWTRYWKSSPTADLQRAIVSRPSARYGVTWEDISTQEDRQHWIAGGRIAVIDLHENKVIAERTGFLMDPGQGSKDGFRAPWTWARSHDKACPSVRGHNLIFVEKILKPVRSMK